MKNMLFFSLLSSFLVVGQASHPLTENWSNLVASLGPAGVLGWYLWFTTSRSFPQIEERHRLERERSENLRRESDAKRDEAILKLATAIQNLQIHCPHETGGTK